MAKQQGHIGSAENVEEESSELRAFKAYLVGQEHSEYLQTILSFKTVQCRNPLHFAKQAKMSTQSNNGIAENIKIDKELQFCHFYHSEHDRRRKIMSEWALRRAQLLSEEFAAASHKDGDAQIGASLLMLPTIGAAQDVRGSSIGPGNKWMPLAYQFVLQDVLKSSSLTSLGKSLIFDERLCSKGQSCENSESCDQAHNIFEVLFHPKQYLRRQCTQRDHLVLYESQQHRQAGIKAYGFEACPFYHTEQEKRFGQESHPYIELTQPQTVLLTTETVLTTSAGKMAAAQESSSAESEEDEIAFADKFNERFKIRAAATRTTSEVSEVISNTSINDEKTEEVKEESKLQQLQQALQDVEAEQDKLEKQSYEISQQLSQLKDEIATLLKQAKDNKSKLKEVQFKKKQWKLKNALIKNLYDEMTHYYVKVQEFKLEINKIKSEEAKQKPINSLVMATVEEEVQTQPTVATIVAEPEVQVPTIKIQKAAPKMSASSEVFCPTSSSIKNNNSADLKTTSAAIDQIQQSRQSQRSSAAKPSCQQLAVRSTFNNRAYMMHKQSARIFQTQPRGGAGSSAASSMIGSMGSLFHVFRYVGGQEILHLNLNMFKVTKCRIRGMHKNKMCEYFHSELDRRRKNRVYSADFCKNHKRKACKRGDQCDMAHSNAERLYHVEKYKTTFCSGDAQDCPYGQICSFAHTEQDLKTRLIHKYPKNNDFYMYYFKTEWCPYLTIEHNKAKCEYAHNWQDFRRKPHLFDYDPQELCQNWQGGTFIGYYHQGCPLQAFCSRAHGWKEQVYHPLLYKIYPCQLSACGKDLICGYYHEEKGDQRVIECPDAVFDANLRRARPLPFRYNEELTLNWYEIVLDNPNNIKEVLYNYRLSAMPASQLRPLLSQQYGLESDVVNCLCERGVVQTDALDQLRLQFQQPQHINLVQLADPECKQQHSVIPLLAPQQPALQGHLAQSPWSPNPNNTHQHYGY